MMKQKTHFPFALRIDCCFGATTHQELSAGAEQEAKLEAGIALTPTEAEPTDNPLASELGSDNEATVL
jgi:hypothetical protein